MAKTPLNLFKTGSSALAIEVKGCGSARKRLLDMVPGAIVNITKKGVDTKCPKLRLTDSNRATKPK